MSEAIRPRRLEDGEQHKGSVTSIGLAWTVRDPWPRAGKTLVSKGGSTYLGGTGYLSTIRWVVHDDGTPGSGVVVLTVGARDMKFEHERLADDILEKLE